MRKRNGLTLIEVLLSIVLIGFIVTFLYPPIFMNYSIIFKGRGITEDIYIARKEMESYIKDIEGGDHTNINFKNITLLDRNIEVTSVEAIISGNNYIKAYIPKHSSIVSGSILDVPVIKDDTVKISPSGPTYGFKSNLILSGSNVILEDNTNYYMSIYNWYISKPGFEGYVPTKVTNVNEGEFGYRYPQWPQDYVKIKTDYNSFSSLDNVKTYIGDFKGRHLVYSIIPISNLGKYGTEVPSEPFYLSGLPVLDPVIHLDVDTIKKEIVNEEKLNWMDILSGKKSSIKDVTVKYSEENKKYVEINNQILFDEEPKLGDHNTIFLVFKNPPNFANTNYDIMNSNKGWKFEMNEGKVKFTIGKDNNINFIESDKCEENVIYIVVGQVSKGNSGKIKLYVNSRKYEINTINTDNYKFQGSNISIGDVNSHFNIYEIIIYNDALQENDIDEVMDYLFKKYEIEQVIKP
ncbi:MAG: type II secretion system GspH family protein [Tissierellaceae bacterium]|nr:type II secretion system GspH family protein [Tissierellaceae bacterium]